MAVADLPRGVAPTADAVTAVDWSGSADEAALGCLLGLTASMDRLASDLVEALVRVVESGAAEEVLGVPLEVLLSQSGRVVDDERRFLLRVATTLVAMPATRRAFRDGWLSWSTVRAVHRSASRLDADGRARVDDLVGELAVSYATYEADALVHEVEVLAGRLAAVRRAERRREPVEQDRLRTMPRLDGSGSLLMDYDSAHFPLLAESIRAHADRHHPLESTPPPPGDDPDVPDAALGDAWRHHAAVAGRNAARRAASLFELVTGVDHDTLEPLAGHESGSRPGVELLVTCDVSTLADGTTPGWLLNGLGGRIEVTAPTIRRWSDAFTGRTNVFLFDEVGEVIGMGHRQRFARGRLRDALVARDLHDTAPCSTTPAVFCDADHVVPWPDGPTDLPNLQLLSRRWHRRKTHGGWRIDRHADGTRTWTAPTGYRVRQPRPPHLRRPPDLGPSP